MSLKQKKLLLQRADTFAIKKDFFIKSRQGDIRQFYDFSPKILGRGAYGVVYKAKLKQPPHTYRAVKLIAKKFIKNPDSLQNEIQILRQLDHPMIIRLYESFEDEKNIYLIQDFCEGGELFERLQKDGNFDETSARAIFGQIIKCIQYLHSQEVAHRDLKPENFLMSSKKNLDIKIIDFGLSYKWKEDMQKEMKAERKNKLIGTAYYMAPEVLKQDYDERCDIWSAGVMLYILTTACPPFNGESDHEIMENVKKMQYSFDIPEAKNLSPELKDLIAKILVPAGKRISLEGILQHPWMTKVLSDKPLTLDFKKLKNFASFSKLKTLAASYIATQLPQKQITHLGHLYQQIDLNSDGYITIEELHEAFRKQNHNTNYAELKEIIEEIDTDRNGKINYNQFITCCLENSQIQNLEYLEFVFKNLDIDKSGKISPEELKLVFDEAGASRTKMEKILNLIEACDKNKDGEIDYQEFIDAMGLIK